MMKRIVQFGLLVLLLAHGTCPFFLRGEDGNPFVSDNPFQIKNRIDEILVESLRRKNMEPAPLCRDEIFVRRVYLDVIGTLPTAQEVLAFLEDTGTDKRSRLINTLLERDEFADYWAMKWSDLLRVKAEFPVNLWPNGAVTYYRWIHQSIRSNKPYNQFVRELLTTDGSNFREGASNFYRAVTARDPETLAETVAQTFLGYQTASWPEAKQKELTVFFSRIGYKETAQWKEEIVFWTHQPLDSQDVVFPDGTKGTVLPDQDPRQVFTDWLVSPDNSAFHRAIANRIWYWLFGYGLVDPDHIRDDQPPVHPELLDYLSRELAEAGYDLKHLSRLILNSAAYQQSSLSRKDTGTEVVWFASYPIRRLEAEVLQDALSQVFNVPVSYQSEVPEPFTNIPARYRTISLPDTSVTNTFLETFGRTTRDTGLETDRNNNITESQQLFLLNSTEVNTWIQKFVANRRINGQVFNGQRSSDRRQLLDDIWLTILSRRPTQAELNLVAEEFRDRTGNQEQTLQDLVWALLNSREFLCKH
ncbi:MAG: DUF1549 and DUF1553 domain-containing protein [Planctomycetaceae bacterium]|jgi:hypothetical protein|nr:DUF1549 and DUF1553 domain-containing protein [Planctomycetaceae bacterium]